MTDNPLVSIIVPVYNVEKYIHKCLDSLVNQTYRNIEIVLVDDGSQDNSGTICDEYAENDKRIVVIHKENQGVTCARIDGLNICQGEMVGFVDSDDYIANNYVEVLLRTFLKYQVDFVVCQHNDIVNNETIPIRRTVNGFLDKEDIKKMISSNLLYDSNTKIGGFPLMLWGKLFKKNIIADSIKEGLGFWYAEDQVTLLSLLYKTHAIYVLPDYLYNYVHYDSQVTSLYRDDYWDAYYKLWNKLIEIDKDRLLDSQLPYRMWIYSKKFYDKAIINITSYKEYLRITKHIYESELIRRYVFHGEVKDVANSRYERVMYHLLKILV